MSERRRGALVKVGEAAVDVGRVGVTLIPLVGGTVTEVIGVLEERRYRRAQRLLDRLVAELGERVSAAEERLSDQGLADLLDDAFERAARTRAEEHIDLIARVVADALLGNPSPEQLDRHHLLVRMASELLPSHFVVLGEIGTSNVLQRSRWPMLGIARTTSALARRFPELADVVEPMVGDLLAAGLVMFTPFASPDAEEAIGQAVRGMRSPRKEPTVELAPYGKWVLEQLAQLRNEKTGETTSDAGAPPSSPTFPGQVSG
jgi:hypothetical protein